MHADTVRVRYLWPAVPPAAVGVRCRVAHSVRDDGHGMAARSHESLWLFPWYHRTLLSVARPVQLSAIAPSCRGRSCAVCSTGVAPVRLAEETGARLDATAFYLVELCKLLEYRESRSTHTRSTQLTHRTTRTRCHETDWEYRQHYCCTLLSVSMRVSVSLCTPFFTD